MTNERIKEIQKGTTAPDSLSLQKALMQVWNEVQQEFEHQLKEKDKCIAELEAKLKRYENPVAEFNASYNGKKDGLYKMMFTGHGNSFIQFAYKPTMLDTKKYHVIVLEGSKNA